MTVKELMHELERYSDDTEILCLQDINTVSPITKVIKFKFAGKEYAEISSN